MGVGKYNCDCSGNVLIKVAIKRRVVDGRFKFSVLHNRWVHVGVSAGGDII